MGMPVRSFLAEQAFMVQAQAEHKISLPRVQCLCVMTHSGGLAKHGCGFLTPQARLLPVPSAPTYEGKRWLPTTPADVAAHALSAACLFVQVWKAVFAGGWRGRRGRAQRLHSSSAIFVPAPAGGLAVPGKVCSCSRLGPSQAVLPGGGGRCSAAGWCPVLCLVEKMADLLLLKASHSLNGSCCQEPCAGVKTVESPHKVLAAAIAGWLVHMLGRKLAECDRLQGWLPEGLQAGSLSRDVRVRHLPRWLRLPACAQREAAEG